MTSRLAAMSAASPTRTMRARSWCGSRPAAVGRPRSAAARCNRSSSGPGVSSGTVVTTRSGRPSRSSRSSSSKRRPDLLFTLGTPLWEFAMCTAIVYLAILFGLRLFGTRERGQMSTGDLVMILLIAKAVQNAMVGPDVSLQGGLTAALVLLAMNFAVVRILGRTSLGERLLEGGPTLL